MLIEHLLYGSHPLPLPHLSGNTQQPFLNPILFSDDASVTQDQEGDINICLDSEKITFQLISLQHSIFIVVVINPLLHVIFQLTVIIDVYV